MENIKLETPYDPQNIIEMLIFTTIIITWVLQFLVALFKLMQWSLHLLA